MNGGTSSCPVWVTQELGGERGEEENGLVKPGNKCLKKMDRGYLESS